MIDACACPASSGPGRISAFDATRSSNRSHSHAAQHVGRERRLELEHAGGAARAQHARTTSGSSNGSASRSDVLAGARVDRSATRVVDDGERREAEEVHLQHAAFSSAFMSYWVTIDVFAVRRRAGALRRLRCTPARTRRAGPARSRRRPRAPPVWRDRPFERDRVVEQLRDSARRCSYELRELVDLLDRLRDREAISSARFGISFASASVSPGVKPSTRPTSLMAARDFMVPNVTIWPTRLRAVLLRARTRSPRRGARSRSRRRCRASTRARDSGSARTAGRT